MDKIRELLNAFARPLLVKWLTRLALYGGSAVSAKLAIAAPSNETVTQAADWTVSALLALAALVIDHFHQTADRKTT